MYTDSPFTETETKPSTTSPYSAIRRYRHAIGFVCLLLFLASSKAMAQNVVMNTERLDSDRPEAWAMNYFTSITLLSGLSVPRSREFGSVEVGFELDWIPHLSAAKRRIGDNGIKVEDLNKSPIFGRPRVTLGLPGNFALTLSYVPPLRIFGVKPHLFAFALERPLYEGGPLTIGMRMYGQIGGAEGDYVCPKENARFPSGSAQNASGCEEKSADKATQRYGGLELSAAYRIDKAGGLTPYITVAGNYLDTQVHVNALTFGLRDRTRLQAETWTFATSAGAAYPLTEKLTLSMGVFYSPLRVRRPPDFSSQHDDIFNVRALLSYQLR